MTVAAGVLPMEVSMWEVDILMVVFGGCGVVEVLSIFEK